LPWEKLSPSVWVVDIVYRKGLTPLVKEAQKKRIRSFDGKEMLLYQGAESFSLLPEESTPWSYGESLDL
jgi:shikimate 5-dehydrogenase